MKNKYLSYIDNHNNWRGNCINLVASENVVSNDVKYALSSDMQHRYFFQNIFSTKSGLDYQYRGTAFVEGLVEQTRQLALDLFNADYVNLDMLSGHQSNLNIIFSYCRPGDTIICSDTEFGGYPGLAIDKLPKYLGVNVEFLPQTEIGGNIDLDLLRILIKNKKPKIVILSSSITLFPFPVKEVSLLCHEYGIPFVYDASHPLGLIAGKQFQDPFSEGADLIIGSTHKSFPGPQGGIILGKGGDFSNIIEATDFVTVDNIHVNRIAALGMALLEMKEFGEGYAIQIIKNAKKLAVELECIGINVKYKTKGYTNSHQFILEEFDDYSNFTLKLEKANIILDNSGRIGLSEITRLGMKEKDMQEIASFFGRIKNGESSEYVKKDTINFMSNFSKINYCYS